MNSQLSLALAAAAVAGLAAQGSKPAPDRPPAEVAGEAGSEELRARFDRFMAERGISIDRALGVAAIRGRFCSPKQPLEYLVTAPRGSHYESLIAVEARPSDVAAALFSLGIGEGKPPARKPKDPRPSEAELAAGATIFDVVPGTGDRVHLYVEWVDDRGFHRHRIEDLVFERPEGRTIPNEGFVFANSLMLQPRSQREVPTYAANADGNLVSCGFSSAPVLSFLRPHPYAMEGDFEIYQPNWTLVPSEPLPVVLLFAKAPLEKPLLASMPPESRPASRPAEGR